MPQGQGDGEDSISMCTSTLLSPLWPSWPIYFRDRQLLLGPLNVIRVTWILNALTGYGADLPFAHLGFKREEEEPTLNEERLIKIKFIMQHDSRAPGSKLAMAILSPRQTHMGGYGAPIKKLAE